MTSFPEAMGWEFGDFEKDVSWDPALGRASPAGGYGMRSAFVGSDRTVSIVKLCVSLSSCRKSKVKKLINVPYLNNGESSAFRIFPASVYLYSCIVTIKHIYTYQIYIFSLEKLGKSVRLSLFLSVSVSRSLFIFRFISLSLTFPIFLYTQTHTQIYIYIYLYIHTQFSLYIYIYIYINIESHGKP